MRDGKIPDILERRQHQWRTRRRYYKEKREKRRMEVGFVLGCYHLGIDFPFLYTSSSFQYIEDVTAKKTIRNTSEEVLRIKPSTKDRQK
jgi:hypothetical protein